MSKMTSWILEREEQKHYLHSLNPFDRHSNTETTAGQYYVDYAGYRNQHEARHHLVRSDSGSSDRKHGSSHST
jgi:hypothetical protein